MILYGLPCMWRSANTGFWELVTNQNFFKIIKKRLKLRNASVLLIGFLFPWLSGKGKFKMYKTMFHHNFCECET